MKKMMVLMFGALFMLGTLLPLSASVSTAKISDDDAAALMSAMDIMYYDAEKEGSQEVTRGELARILVKSSKYKGLALSGSKTSPFSDVAYTHPCASYISVASLQKILTPYSNGEFRPDQTVRHEEAVTAVLKLLGYNNEDFVGGYPFGQLSMAQDKKILDGLQHLRTGDLMQNKDVAKLIYNLLCAMPKEGNVTYGETLGYTVSDGILSLGGIRMQNMKGPFTLKDLDDLKRLGLSAKPQVYIDGTEAILEEIELYDIIYYNENMDILAAYTERVRGYVTNVSPNREMPSSIVIDDEVYELTTYAAKEAFGLGKLGQEDYVIVLLDRNGQAADVYAELKY